MCGLGALDKLVWTVLSRYLGLDSFVCNVLIVHFSFCDLFGLMSFDEIDVIILIEQCWMGQFYLVGSAFWKYCVNRFVISTLF